ncbi:hypothetical protein OS493_018319 [Desmophyllum pertusum]|uniref:Pectinesterase inhibitor domain-containing protein n=1 Tax=Desmophyllum pertusum TaxID=174260 RepID=A0A9W9YC01_9CNID|nr:hypothetical protein OS493_018319 [Desmophyllum pertusum]
MNSRGIALFLFIQTLSSVSTAIEATKPDSCALGIKTLSAKMDKLEANIDAITRGLLLNPEGSSYASCKDIYQNQKTSENDPNYSTSLNAYGTEILLSFQHPCFRKVVRVNIIKSNKLV